MTLFSQSINPDKKIDSFYCYGPTKARELAKLKANSIAKDTIIEQQGNEIEMCEYVVKEYQQAYKDCDGAVNKANAQIQHKEIQLEAKENENRDLKKQIKKAKIQSWIERTALAGSLILNGILIIKK